MQNRNNLLVVCVIAVIVFLCGIPLTWFTINGGTSSFGMPFPFPMEGTGINGTITLLLPLPIWLLLLVSAGATLITTLNINGATTIPKAWPTIGLLFCGVYYASPLFYVGDQLRIAAGPIVALLDTLLALGIILQSRGRMFHSNDEA